MKKSKSIRLVLLGGLSAGAFSGCTPSNPPAEPLLSGGVYTNDYHVAGVGYYHAPFRAWYPLPYNHYDPTRHMYFHGGQWSQAPHQSSTTVSSPSEEALQQARSNHSGVRRNGFGSSSSSTHSISS